MFLWIVTVVGLSCGLCVIFGLGWLGFRGWSLCVGCFMVVRAVFLPTSVSCVDIIHILWLFLSKVLFGVLGWADGFAFLWVWW